MKQKEKIAIIIGSLNKGSSSEKLAKVLGNKFSEHLEPKYIDISQLEYYNPDLETENPPTSWSKFRREVSECTSVLFITPEYNRTIPAVLKNAIDVGSQPFNKSVWEDMAGAVVSVAGGSLGGFGANHHLRQAVVYVNINLMQQPEAYIPHVNKLFDEQGSLINDSTDKFLDDFVLKFEQWIERLK